MNREIKFRAWDIVEKKMRDYDDVSIILNSNDLKDLNSNWRKLNLNFIIQSLNIEGLKILQYTWLNDKNGKEIYEGDILKWGNNEVYEVFWENGGFHTKWNVGNGRYDIEPLYSVEDFEIIGNVFDNPELLK